MKRINRVKTGFERNVSRRGLFLVEEDCKTGGIAWAHQKQGNQFKNPKLTGVGAKRSI